MTLLYYDSCFLEHDTGPHPEGASRLRSITKRLDEQDLLERCARPMWEPATPERLARVHELPYVAAVEQFASAGGGYIEGDTIVSPRSYEVALHAAGATCNAVERVVAGEDATAICLIRPPGHHAVRTGAMGFCLFNNIAVAARVATRELGVERVLIVDWDVHHGNGTQDAFFTDERVGFFSIHRWPFYPGTGLEHETGRGPGLGTTLNVPVEFGIARQEYLTLFAGRLGDFADQIRPQLILLSAGFDTHRLDPVGSLGLETEDFTTLTEMVQQLADTHAEGRLVSVLEGGYNTEVLGASVAAHLAPMLGEA